jgi:hypothetical protein
MVCNRPNGHTQCARFSTLPFLVTLIAALAETLGLLGLALVALTPVPLNNRILMCVVVSTLVLVIMSLYYRSGWRLMRAVAPMNNGATRVLPGEERRHG